MFYIKIGIKNIIKNFRRSFITMISIIIGIMASLLTEGFFRWNGDSLREYTIRSGTGHFQLYKKGYLKHGSETPYSYLIENPSEIEKEIKSIGNIKLVTSRIQFSGIISSGKKSTVVSGEAGISENEQKLNTYSGVVEGKPLSSDKPDGIIIGCGVAKKISSRLSNTLTLMCNMKDGGINALDFTVVGISKTGFNEVDNIFATAHLEYIQSLLNVEKGVQKIIVILEKTSDAKTLVSKIEELCKKYGLEYKTWEKLADFYNSVKIIYDAIFVIIILIVLFIVTFTISNTVNMNVYDRIREIGTIRALGTKKTQVAGIFIAESGLIGIIGSIFGLVLTYSFILFTELIKGLPVFIKSGGKYEITRVFFRPDLITIISCFVLFTLVTIVASLIPSYKASKISITEALRWV